MVYRVPSDSRPGRAYEVDLTSNQGAGFCPCKDFSTRRQPNLDAGCEPWTKPTVCKHLALAGHHFLRLLLKEMSHEENHPTKTNQSTSSQTADAPRLQKARF